MLENGKRKLIYGFIGFGCGIALSGIMMLVVVLNTNEYQQSLINYISSSDKQKEDIGQINTIQPKSIEKSPINDGQIIEETVIENNNSNNEVTEDNIVSGDNQKQSESILVYIPKNSSSAKICKILQEQGVILDANDFEDYIIMNKKEKYLKSGEIILPSKASYDELLKNLVSK